MNIYVSYEIMELVCFLAQNTKYTTKMHHSLSSGLTAIYHNKHNYGQQVIHSSSQTAEILLKPLIETYIVVV